MSSQSSNMADRRITHNAAVTASCCLETGGLFFSLNLSASFYLVFMQINAVRHFKKTFLSSKGVRQNE